MDIFICPVCKDRLNKSDRDWYCKSNHRFDIAKEGYVNLLPANAKKTVAPGDNKQMVGARRDFLSKGYFAPLAEKLSMECVGDVVLDAGCGTGYYGEYIKNHSEQDVCVYGIDISKFAVRLASKAGYDGAVVASLVNMPFLENAFDCAISVFAPIYPDEFTRVIKKSGLLLIVSPAERHMIELKSVMYGERTYENTPENAQKPLLLKNGAPAFEFIKRDRLTFKKEIESQQDILSLVGMTPYFYKTDENEKSKLSTLSSMICTFDFYVTVYKNLL